MQLTFPNGEHASVAFEHGELSIGSRAGQSVSLPGKSLAPLHASLVRDRRGLWLRVPEGVPGVHLNARPVRRIAMLRIGDQVCLEQVQVVLAENDPDMIDRIIPPSAPAPLNEAQRVSASRVAIRGISGNLCGRSFTLTEPKLVGRGTGCDIRIDDAAVAERECQFELHGDRVVLRSLSHGEFTSVNGVPVADAVLAPGDQVVIDQHRFLVEAPGLPARGQDRLRAQAQQQHTQTMKAVRVPQANPTTEQRDPLEPPPQPVDPGALWWLIAAAAVLAAAMTALLVYSPHMGAA